MSHITVISYEEYEKGKNVMSCTDISIHNLLMYKDTHLSDVEQMVATLKGVLPADLSVFDELVIDRGPTGVAHDIDYAK